MVASDGLRLGSLPAATLALFLALGCRSASPTAPATPPAAAPATEPIVEAAPTPLAPEAPVPTEPAPPPSPPGAAAPAGEVVIKRGGEAAPAEPPPTLYEASLKARAERAAREGHATRVVTDTTLKQQAARGEITVANVPAAAIEEESEAAPGDAEAAPAPAGGEEELSLSATDPELYWRRRVRDARLRWRAAVEQLAELEDTAAALRWDFYATDDPFYRDSQIKPAWDRALAQLEVARQSAEFEHESLQLILEDGRRAGALPGWLREGLELEPASTASPRGGELPEHTVGEPVEAEDPDGKRR